MPSTDAIALTWCARVSVAIGLAAAILGLRSGLETYHFLSKSLEAEGTVVDWSQGDGQAGRSAEPGAYYPVIEVVTRDGTRIVGEAETGVSMSQLRIGERLTVRYRPEEPARMRVAALSGLWLKEGVFAVLAIAFCAAGTVLIKQARKGAPTGV